MSTVPLVPYESKRSYQMIFTESNQAEEEGMRGRGRMLKGKLAFFEKLLDGMEESPISNSLSLYVGKYANTACEIADAMDECHCSREEIEEGRCHCFDFMEDRSYRLKYLTKNHSIIFSFNYDYDDPNPESVTVIQSSLSADDTEFLRGVIRAAYDVYYAQKHGLKGYPEFIRCFEGLFYEGMRVVYSLVPGFDHPRDVITLPDAVEQKKEASGQSDVKLKGKRKHKHRKNQVEEAYTIFASIYPNQGAKRKEPEPQAIVSRREFKNWLGGNHSSIRRMGAELRPRGQKKTNHRRYVRGRKV